MSPPRRRGRTMIAAVHKANAAAAAAKHAPPVPIGAGVEGRFVMVMGPPGRDGLDELLLGPRVQGAARALHVAFPDERRSVAQFRDSALGALDGACRAGGASR